MQNVAADKDTSLSEQSKRQLEYATSTFVSKKEDDSVILSSNNYMKCSTYVKSNAMVIARSEHKRMKMAIKCNQTNLLYDSCSHLTPHMVKLQETIDKVPGKLPRHSTELIGAFRREQSSLASPIDNNYTVSATPDTFGNKHR